MRVAVHIKCTRARNKTKSFVIQTVNIDVIVILSDVFFELTANKLFADIWVAFGISKNF